MSQQFQIPRKPPLSSHQTAIDEDETGLKYNDDDETAMPAVTKPLVSNMPAVSKPPVSNMPASLVSNIPAVSKPPVSNMPASLVNNIMLAFLVSNMPAVSKPPVSNMLPHNLDEILKDADKQIDLSSTQKIYEQLYSGIYLKQKRQKFWVDKNLKNCFMLYARDLWISWGCLPCHWQWPTMFDQESSEVSTFEAAELVNICWLQISGKFETFKLSPGTTYEVVFILMIKNPSYGWHIPVNVSLTVSYVTNHHMKNLNEIWRGLWIEIPVGVFTTSAHQTSIKYNPRIRSGQEKMEVCLHEISMICKKGLVIKGVRIRPAINP